MESLPWANYGVIHHVPVTYVTEQTLTWGTSLCSLSSRACAPKTQPIRVHTEGQQRSVAGCEGTQRMCTKWQPNLPRKCE